MYRPTSMNRVHLCEINRLTAVKRTSFSWTCSCFCLNNRRNHLIILISIRVEQWRVTTTTARRLTVMCERDWWMSTRHHHHHHKAPHDINYMTLPTHLAVWSAVSAASYRCLITRRSTTSSCSLVLNTKTLSCWASERIYRRSSATIITHRGRSTARPAAQPL